MENIEETKEGEANHQVRKMEEMKRAKKNRLMNQTTKNSLSAAVVPVDLVEARH